MRTQENYATLKTQRVLVSERNSKEDRCIDRATDNGIVKIVGDISPGKDDVTG